MTNVTHLRNNKPKTVDEWRNYILEPWQKAVESIIETGLRLIEAKDEMEYGSWVKIFEDNKPFGIHTADRLMAIARHPVLSNCAHAHNLPRSWYTLYELSHIPEKDLQKLIDNGKVHSELTRGDLETLFIEEQKQEEEKEKLSTVLLANIHSAIEWSLADCSGSPFDCSILKDHHTIQEIRNGVHEVVRVWKRLADHLDSLATEEVS
jgi:hypothetical protein